MASFFDEQAVAITFENGDVLFTDNMLVAHSRTEYEGDREVMVALADRMLQEQLPPTEAVLASLQ